MSKKAMLTTLGAAMILAGDAAFFHLIAPHEGAVLYVIGIHCVLLVAAGVVVICSAWEPK